MLTNVKRRHNGKSEAKSLDVRRVRAGLIMLDQSLRSFARAEGVSHTLLIQIINGDRPARSGRSKAIRRKLEEIAA